MIALRKPTLTYSFGLPPEGTDVLWRCEVRRYSIVIDAEAELFGSSDAHVLMTWYAVKKRTRCGAWIEGRFVNLQAKRQWASNTVAEALDKCIRRKRRQVAIYDSHLSAYKKDLAVLEAINV